MTPRWREMDSNCRFLGRETVKPYGRRIGCLENGADLAGNRWLESISLQRRVEQTRKHKPPGSLRTPHSDRLGNAAFAAPAVSVSREQD